MFSMPTMHERISWFCGGYIAVSLILNYISVLNLKRLFYWSNHTLLYKVTVVIEYADCSIRVYRSFTVRSVWSGGQFICKDIRKLL